MNIKFHEEKLANNPHDAMIKGRLAKLRKQFNEVTAKHAGYAD
jgi:hypothetical protein